MTKNATANETQAPFQQIKEAYFEKSNALKKEVSKIIESFQTIPGFSELNQKAQKTVIVWFKSQQETIRNLDSCMDSLVQTDCLTCLEKDFIEQLKKIESDLEKQEQVVVQTVKRLLDNPKAVSSR